MFSALLRLSVPERDSPSANTWNGSVLFELVGKVFPDFDSMVKQWASKGYARADECKVEEKSTAVGKSCVVVAQSL